MLTGDKVETAKCIAISTGLKTNKEEIYAIDSSKMESVDEKTIEKMIFNYEDLTSTHMLMIDGTCLSVLIANEELSKKFFDVT